MMSPGTGMDSLEMVEAELNKVKDGHQQLVLEVIKAKVLDGSHKSPDLALRMRAGNGSG